MLLDQLTSYPDLLMDTSKKGICDGISRSVAPSFFRSSCRNRLTPQNVLRLGSFPGLQLLPKALSPFADDPSAVTAVTDFTPDFSTTNLHTYDRLKLSLQLGLRRQVFLAVCDDLTWRDRMVRQLQHDLESTRQSDYPAVVTLVLNLSDPNPIAQITQWLKQSPPPTVSGQRMAMPAFQIVGIEQLMRQSLVQRLFYNYLQNVERSLPRLESSLIFWLPRPWLNMLPVSAPDFWRCRTAVFEFVGNPTPALQCTDNALDDDTMQAIDDWDLLSEPADDLAHSVFADLTMDDEPSPAQPAPASTVRPPDSRPSDSRSSDSRSSESPDSSDRVRPGSRMEPAPQDGALPLSPDELWAILHHDISVAPAEIRHEPSRDRPMPHSPPTQSPNPPSPPGLPAEHGDRDPWDELTYTDDEGNGRSPTPHESDPPPSDNNHHPPRLQIIHSADRTHDSQPNAPRRTSNGNGHGDQKTLVPLTMKTAVAADAIADSASQRTAQTLRQTLKRNRTAAIKPADQSVVVVARETKSVPTHADDGIEAQAKTPTTAIAQDTKAATQTPLDSSDLDPISLKDQIDHLHKQHAPPDLLANAYRTLGNVYRDRIERGLATAEDLDAAIQAYEQVLVWLHETSPLWADVLNDLGNLHWMMSRQSSTPHDVLANLQQAIQAYQLALNKINIQNQVASYTMVQSNLGAAYGDLARYQDTVNNLQRSIQSYQQALRHRKPDTDPQRYALTQNNLGTTYWNLAQHHQPKIYLKQAIASYSEALRFYSPEVEPMNHAMIQNNLGTAYWNLAQHERPREWLMLALAAYRTALRYRTRKAAPAAYAATQNNLGTAYWHLANHAKESPDARLDYLQQAIAAYKAAVAVAHQIQQDNPTAPPLNFDLFATYNNLGLADYQLGNDAHISMDAKTRNQHMESALEHHLKALEGWKQRPELREATMKCVLQTIRAFYTQGGISGQNVALSKVPGHLLPELLPQL